MNLRRSKSKLRIQHVSQKYLAMMNLKRPVTKLPHLAKDVEENWLYLRLVTLYPKLPVFLEEIIAAVDPCLLPLWVIESPQFLKSIMMKRLKVKTEGGDNESATKI